MWIWSLATKAPRYGGGLSCVAMGVRRPIWATQGLGCADCKEAGMWVGLGYGLLGALLYGGLAELGACLYAGIRARHNRYK